MPDTLIIGPGGLGRLPVAKGRQGVIRYTTYEKLNIDIVVLLKIKVVLLANWHIDKLSGRLLRLAEIFEQTDCDRLRWAPTAASLGANGRQHNQLYGPKD